jgi:hypothetical protein
MENTEEQPENPQTPKPEDQTTEGITKKEYDDYFGEPPV